jgi:dynein heavy chain
LIDFSITPVALEDQLLTLVIQHERMDIETKKHQLMEAILKNEQELKQLEDQILLLIGDPNVMGDPKLAASLTASKSTAGL